VNLFIANTERYILKSLIKFYKTEEVNLIDEKYILKYIQEKFDHAIVQIKPILIKPLYYKFVHFIKLLLTHYIM